MQPIEVSRHAVEVVADLLARADTGETRTSDGVTQQLQALVADRLQATEPGAAALAQLTQNPGSEQAKQAATVALATAASFDPELPGLLAHQVTAVHWLWQHEARGPGAGPPPDLPTTSFGGQQPRRGRRRRGGVIAVVVAAVLLLGGGGAAAWYFTSDRPLVSAALGSWDCEYHSFGSFVEFTAIIEDGTFELRDPRDDQLVYSHGSWELAGGDLHIDAHSDQLLGRPHDGRRSWTVTGLAEDGPERNTLLNVLSDQDLRWNIDLSSYRGGREVELTADPEFGDFVSVFCAQQGGSGSTRESGSRPEAGAPAPDDAIPGDLTWDDGDIRIEAPDATGSGAGNNEIMVTNYTDRSRSVTIDYVCAPPHTGPTQQSPAGFVTVDVAPFDSAWTTPEAFSGCSAGEALYITWAGHSAYHG